MAPTPLRSRVPLVASSGLLLLSLSMAVPGLGDDGYNVLYATVMVGASALAIAGAVQHEAGSRRVPALVAAGLGASAVGDVVWALLARDGQEVGEITVADAPYVVGSLLVAVGLFVAVVARHDRGLDVDATVDALTVIVVTVLLLWDVQTHVGLEGATTFQSVVLTTYPVLDAVMLGLVVRLMWSPRRTAGGTPLMAFGTALWAGSDLAFLMGLLDVDSTLLSLGWLVGTVLMAWSTWAEPVDRPALREAGPGARMLVAILPLLIPPALVVAHGIPDLHKAGAVAALLVLILLAFVRTRRLLDSEARARRDSEAARDAALAASRAKSDFLATISHEIRTPMNGVIGLTELLRATDLDRRQRQYAEGVATAARDLMTIIDDLLDFTKIEAGHIELVAVPVDVGRLLTDVTDLVLDRSRRGEVGIVVHSDVPPVVGDLGRLRQVLLNLVSNAVKFTAHGEVRATATVVGEHDGRVDVLVEVTDTGIGISPSDLATVFEPFSQADGSSTTQYGGTGLGLSISHRIVAAMGGRLEAESTPGQGSRFFFTLPMTRVTRTRVLLVEDTHVNQLVAEAVLTHLGHDVVTDAAPAEVDIVVADLGRAGALVNDSAPVIGVATGSVDRVRTAGRASGLVDVVERPLDPRSLQDAIVRSLASGPGQRAASTVTTEPGSTTVPG